MLRKWQDMKQKPVPGMYRAQMHRRKKNYSGVVSEELLRRGANQSYKDVGGPVSRGNILTMRTTALAYRVLYQVKRCEPLSFDNCIENKQNEVPILGSQSFSSHLVDMRWRLRGG